MLKTSICSQYACVLVMLNLKPFECLLVLPAHDTFKISEKKCTNDVKFCSSVNDKLRSPGYFRACYS